jgi:hypothetical protein
MSALEHTIHGDGSPLGSTEDPRPARSPRWKQAVLTAVPVTLLFALFLVNGLRGVDFGYHWDEMEWHITPARQMVATGILLPHKYIYPSFDKYLVLVPAIPAAIQAGFRPNADPTTIQAAMGAAMDVPGYLLKAREVYIAVSALAILWIYGAALALRYSWWQATVAAAGIGLSWQIAYHARYANTDCILVQFVALTLLMLALHHRTEKTGWLFAAAVAAGFGLGTKYTGLFLIGSVVIAGALALPLFPLRDNLWPQTRRALALGALAFAAYIVTTPATLIDPVQFLMETRGISQVYGQSHGGFTATSGWDHGRIMLTFLAITYFSPSRLAALVAFLIAVVGAVFLIREDRKLAAVLLICPFLFLAAFCAKYRIAVARNALYTTPMMALLLGRGVGAIGQWVGHRAVRAALAVVLALGMLAQAAWLIDATERIRHDSPQIQVMQAYDYLGHHPRDRFRVSRRVQAIGAQMGLPLPPNVTAENDPSAKHVMFFGEQDGPNPYVWKVNDPWLTEAVFGAGEVDFNWYSSWAGHDRIVVIAIDKARSFGVDLAK